MPLSYSPSDPPIASLITVAIINNNDIDIKQDSKITNAQLETSSQTKPVISNDFETAKKLCLECNALHSLLLNQPESFNGSDKAYRSEIEFWVQFATSINDAISNGLKNLNKLLNTIGKRLTEIESHLKFRTFFVGHQLTLADIVLFVSLGKLFKYSIAKESIDEKLLQYTNLLRWWSFMYHINPLTIQQLHKVVEAASIPLEHVSTNKEKTDNAIQSQQHKTTSSNLYEGKLPGAERGFVVTRFPPEPSGYLHIGHAKAALLNAYYAKYYEGRLLIRFDDTNPAKEKMEFEESILKDLSLLDIDVKHISHTSDYFEVTQNLCEKLIQEGVFYIDSTPLEQMRKERNEGIESQYRDVCIDENLRRWKEMKQGSSEGIRCCVRAKIDMQSKNKCMRDPVMYRCITDTPHHLHGTTYKVYPMYDFACPIVDSLEGVTHAMRTNEYADRIPQYQWVLSVCKLRPVTIYEFSRLNFVNTVLSKRKLQWIVDSGIVESWEDPRFPTVRGIRRRGLTVQALMEFILEQGPSKNVNLMEWDKLWAKNKQILDPIVPRYMAVDGNKVSVLLSNGPKETEIKERDLHLKNPAVGKGVQIFDKSICIEPEDAAMLTLNEEITLMRWQNAIVEHIERNDSMDKYPKFITMRLNPDGDFKKTKKKLHWVATPDVDEYKPARVCLREYDHLIIKKKPEEDDKIEDICNHDSVHDTEVLADPSVLQLNEGACIQFERRGYFRLDRLPHTDKSTSLAVFIKIPDGKSKAMSVIEGKVDAGKLAKGH